MDLKLQQKDIKTLKLGALVAAAILLFLFISDGYSRWKEAREDTEQLKEKLEKLDKNAGLAKSVPVFEMPVTESQEGFRFRDSFIRQLESAGINDPHVLEDRGGRSPLVGYSLLCYKWTDTCRFEQVLNIIAALKENPYLVGIEEIRFDIAENSRSGGNESDGRGGGGGMAFGGRGGGMGGRGGGGNNRQQAEVEITVSTLIKDR